MRYEVHVFDPFGRPAKVVVEVSPERVGISGPPGDGFSVGPEQADVLSDVLRAAAIEARGHTRHGPYQHPC